MIPSKKLCKLSTIHSQKFCAPLGISLTCRIARRAKTINPTATTQLTAIELVMGKPRGFQISVAFCGTPCSSSAPAAAPLEVVGMTTFMDKPQEVNRLPFDLVTDVKWKWPGAATGEAVGTYVVASFPLDNFPCLSGNTLVKSARQPLRNFAVLRVLLQQ